MKKVLLAFAMTAGLVLAGPVTHAQAPPTEQPPAAPAPAAAAAPAAAPVAITDADLKGVEAPKADDRAKALNSTLSSSSSPMLVSLAFRTSGNRAC